MTDFRSTIRKLTIALALSIVTSSCATQRLWDEERFPDYIEEILMVYLSPDTNQLAVIGREYHYVFDLSNDLAASLQPAEDVGESLTIRVKGLALSSAIKVAGHVEISKPVKRRWKAKTYRTSITKLITGTRFLSASSVHGRPLWPTKSYEVHVRGSSSYQVTARKILLTPITLVADGLAVLKMGELIGVLVAIGESF